MKPRWKAAIPQTQEPSQGSANLVKLFSVPKALLFSGDILVVLHDPGQEERQVGWWLAGSTGLLLFTSSVLISWANASVLSVFMWELGLKPESSHLQGKQLQTEKSPSPSFSPVQNPRPIHLSGPYSCLLHHNHMIIF